MPDLVTTYGSNVEMEQYFVEHGYDLPVTEDEMNRLRLIGSLFVDGLFWRRLGYRAESRLTGQPTTPGQPRAWPRVDAVDYYGNSIGPNETPPAVRYATYEAARYEQTEPGVLHAAVRQDQVVVQEKFGDISFTYAEVDPVKSQVVIPAIETLLYAVMEGGQHPYGTRRLTRV